MKNRYLQLSLLLFSVAFSLTVSPIKSFEVAKEAITQELKREIRYITPPTLENENFGEKVVCTRPMRNGSPRMEVEEIDDKLIAHNYGHGGSGWTLGMGSAQHVNSLLLKHSPTLQKDTPITIIGAGIIGLSSAYDLTEKGYSNLTIYAKEFENLTSHRAGGLFAPVSMNNSPEMQTLVDQIGFNTYSFYQKIIKGGIPGLEGCVEYLPSYFDTREESELEPFVKSGLMKAAKDVTLDFGTEKTRNMVAYDDGMFVHSGIMMEKLSKLLKEKNVKFFQKDVKDFSEIESNYIINCSGLGAKELNNDAEMVPVQGHLISLKKQVKENLNYLIIVYFDEGISESGHPIKRSFYMFPKKFSNGDFGVIGGTFIKGASGNDKNNGEFKKIIENTKNFYGVK